ncbi:uncharacterized protein KY384_005944 [Bacidia gigantensis]|uniref:uncharacterized protein n=1 Tax=Bacidia gigantensis TaxID=2732470 RepID=UPI001D054588|nr:uncharacterized protein KY384_005944 [Bacidia gigantensis]KAG8529308.1 hypothetical protein KY384_005944 [Bacidia gigantensis]
MKDMYELCGTISMHVIGTLNNSPSPNTSFDPDHLLLETTPGSTVPTVLCPSSSPLSVQIVLFDRPSSYRMEYMSLAPIPLVLGDKPVINTTRTFGDATTALNDREGSAAKARLIEKLKLHTVVRRQPSQKERLLSTILTQINCSGELASLINNNLYHLRGRQKRSLSVGEKVVQSATTLRNYAQGLVWQFAITWLWPFLIRLLIFLLVCQRVAAEIVLLLLEWRPNSDSRALKDLSATAQQLDIRLQQFCYWPIQNMTLRKRKRSWESVTDKHPDYIRFYSSLWLVANDIIIGMAVGSYIIDNAEWVAHQISLALNDWTVEGLMNVIRWLREYPAGLKLNNELANFLGRLVLLMIEYFKSWFVALQPWLPSIIYYIGIASFAGTTMPIAIFSDLLSLATYHILCFYTAFARIFHWQLTIILSLFHLFRGKKKNVLRKRIDSCDYDLDQLLLGTILFTLLFFLLPTVVVFYLTFTTARMGVMFMNAALDMLLALLNHFPIFALMLRIKDSRRLPGEISSFKR